VEWLLLGRPRVGTPTEMGRQDVQQWLFAAVSGFLQAVASVAPIALTLDDLHWADESSLKLLQYLARQTRASRVLLLGTYRNTELVRGHPLERALRDLHREGLLEEVPVRRLEQQGTAELAAALLGEAKVSDEFVQLVHDQTDGNPFFTQEVMRALVERGDVFKRDGIWDRRALAEIEVPRSVRSAVGERIARLSAQTQEVLHEAAVLGQVFTFDDLLRMGDRAEDEVDEALEEALVAMLIRLADTDEYSFNHALTQQTLYSELSPRRRKRLHQAVGEALEQLPESARRRRAGQIAWHFLEAHSGERAVPFILLAGDEAETVFAHSEAETHYRKAIHLAGALRDPRREADGLEKLGTLLRIGARHHEALDVLERAATLDRELGSIEAEGRAIRELGFVHYYLGTPEQGIERIQATAARLQQQAVTVQSSRALADLYGAMSIDLWPGARYSETLSAAERAAEFARTGEYPRSLALAETFRGMALTMVGPLPDARRVLEEAAALCVASGETWWMINTIGSTGRAYLDEGKFEQGKVYLERSRTLTERIHDRGELSWILSNIGEACYLLGEWTVARATYERAVSLARELGDVRFLSYALLHLAELSAVAGNWEDAKPRVEEGLEIAQRSGAVPSVRKAQRLLAEHDLTQGQAEEAVTRLQPLLGSPEDDWPRAFPPPVLAEAYLELGNVVRAEELVLQRVRRFRAQQHRRALALWLRVEGTIRRRQHRFDEADRAYAEALLLAHAMPYPYAEALILAEYGRLHLEQGERELARTRLDDALSIFRQLGARPDVDRIRNDLHALG
jgi:tetratricopeptide (TPR) repeat protein